MRLFGQMSGDYDISSVARRLVHLSVATLLITHSPTSLPLAPLVYNSSIHYQPKSQPPLLSSKSPSELFLFLIFYVCHLVIISLVLRKIST